MIRIVLALVLTAFLHTLAMASDSAERNIIGFSPDGTWFAFEEFGISDGSGSPYSNIYVVNTLTDTWAQGTPIRVSFGEEEAPLSKARDKAHKQAAEIISRLDISEAGILLASNPVTQISSNPRRIDFYRHMSLSGPSDKTSYVLKEVDFPDRTSCKEIEVDEKGFALSFTKGGSPLKEVYRDKLIPASRGCPKSYTISDVIEFNPEKGASRRVILIHMFKRGFEGDDARYLAVPVLLP